MKRASTRVEVPPVPLDGSVPKTVEMGEMEMVQLR